MVDRVRRPGQVVLVSSAVEPVVSEITSDEQSSPVPRALDGHQILPPVSAPYMAVRGQPGSASEEPGQDHDEA